jgi:predicted  nucleic acid-binding Zn-ribbon protein
MNPVFKLYRLQQVDSQLDQFKSRLEEIATILADNAALNTALMEAEATAETRASTEKDLRRAEQNTQSQRDKIRQTETRLYSGAVKNPKELEDLQNEAAALKRYLAVLEDRQLEAMLALDEAEAIAQAAQEKYDRLHKQSLETHASLVAEQSEIEQDSSRLSEERGAAAAGIPSDTLHHYNDLRGKRQGVAVARVADNSCSACGSTLSASLRQGVRDPNQIAHCTFCSRILYAQ